MKFTEKFRLPLYEAADRVLKEQFNETNRKVEAALMSMIPSGVIVMWAGAANAIPEGWALCDGSNGTPNLRNRFVVGAGGTYNTGATGGEEKHTLSTSEMPSHTHPFRIATDASAGHVQTSGIEQTYRFYMPSATNNSSYLSNVGGGAAHNNMPPYYALCFIMKL